MTGPQRHDGGDLERRVAELEMRTEFAAKATEDLDAVVRDLGGRVDRIQRELSALRRQLESLPAPPPADADAAD